jgi:hypothetical protein
MRLIVNFDSVGKTVVLKLSRGPAAIAGINQGRTVRIGPLRGANAQARGEELVKLLGRHEPVKQALTMALAQPPAAPPQPIYLRVISDVADALPWEQLYWKAQGFLALDPRWPVGRIAATEWELNDRAFLAPFRIVAVLSAAQRQGSGQLDALATAVADARKRKMDVKLHVITGEQAVYDRVGALGRKHVTREWIGVSADDVARQIADAKPSILHVLCHGDYSAGVRGLRLASQADFLAQADAGSVPLALGGLARALSLCDPWLVVLAACETAGVTEDSSAFARGLVDTGIPAVIGMRRLVDLGAMNRFAQALYPEVLRTIEAALRPDPNQPPVRTIDWITTLTAPRQAAIVGVDPAQDDAWSDPVLYAQQDTLRVYVPTKKRMSAEEYAQAAGHIDTLVSYRQGLDPATTPADVLNDLDTRIAELRAGLPDKPDEPDEPVG